MAIPANLASVMFVQIRMIAAIAHLGGQDLRNDKVRTLCYACMCGSASADVLKEVGIKLGEKLTEQAIKQITGTTITRINRAVGFRLITKFGQKGLINFGKMVPLIGGVVGGDVRRDQHPCYWNDRTNDIHRNECPSGRLITKGFE